MLCSMTVTGKHDWNQILPAAGQDLRAVGMGIAPISVRCQGSFVDLKENTVFTGSLYNCVVIYVILGIINVSQDLYNRILHYVQKSSSIFFPGLWPEILIMHAGDCVVQLIKKLLPQGKTTVFKAQLRMLPTISFISAFLNNTPVVVIFAPIIKRWAESVKLPATKFLIPLSYVTILGGICTLIGTSTNLVVHGMILDAGYEGFTMFELGKVGIFIAIAGIIYLFLFSSRLLPDVRKDAVKPDDEPEEHSDLHRVEAVLGPRFPGINKKLKDFNFKRHYGAEVKEIKRNGQSYVQDLENEYFREGDTLVVMADDSFVQTWGESSVFVMLANGKDTEPVASKGKRWFALALLILMITGATVGELPAVKEAFPDIKLDMFFFVSVTTILMAWTKIFPARKYTKYISWDILITIACAFAISKAMVNSGVADAVAEYIIGLTDHYGPAVLLAVMFVITNLFTELITNNAAAALAFPLALSISSQLGVSPTPFFVVICMAASASFSTPIGYQTNLIVQGIGNYKFTDFVRIGLPLNIITFLISIFLIPLIWPF